MSSILALGRQRQTDLKDSFVYIVSFRVGEAIQSRAVSKTNDDDDDNFVCLCTCIQEGMHTHICVYVYVYGLSQRLMFRSFP